MHKTIREFGTMIMVKPLKLNEKENHLRTEKIYEIRFKFHDSSLFCYSFTRIQFALLFENQLIK